MHYVYYVQPSLLVARLRLLVYFSELVGDCEFLSTSILSTLKYPTSTYRGFASSIPEFAKSL